MGYRSMAGSTTAKALAIASRLTAAAHRAEREGRDMTDEEIEDALRYHGEHPVESDGEQP